MRNRIVWAVCLITLVAGSISCGSGNDNKTTLSDTEIAANLKKYGIKGKVKTIRQRVYWTSEKFGRIEKGKRQNMAAQDFLQVFNENGQLIEEIHYDAKDTEVSRKVNTYDKSLLAKEEYYNSGKLQSIIVYTYGGNLIKQKDIQDGNGKLKERYAYSYTDLQMIQDEDKYNAAEKLVQKIVHTYEGKLLTEQQYYTGGGTLFRRKTFSYDDNSQLISQVTYKYQNKAESFESRTTFGDYNSFGKYQVKTTYNEQDQVTEEVKYAYDMNENLVSQTVSKPLPEVAAAVPASADNVDESYNSENENSNNVAADEPESTESIYEREWEIGSGSVFEYGYDTVQNWTKKVTYKLEEKTGNRVRQLYFERVIEYR